jgi:hypothetical protein
MWIPTTLSINGNDDFKGYHTQSWCYSKNNYTRTSNFPTRLGIYHIHYNFPRLGIYHLHYYS